VLAFGQGGEPGVLAIASLMLAAALLVSLRLRRTPPPAIGAA